MQEIGLMQGRLTPSRGRGIQFFPGAPGEWQWEFELAPAAGISSIEWVCEKDNVLFTAAGRRELEEVMTRTGVRVCNMDLHELLTKTDIVKHPDELFEKVCEAMGGINGGTVELPLVEASSLLEESAYDARVASLRRFLQLAEKHKVPVAVETDLGPEALRALTEEVPEITVVYDVGNSAGLGYDMEEEFKAYGKCISNVHIKDKSKGGSTVPLGTGDVDFPKLFSLLRQMLYTGLVTIQAARGEDGKEAETIKDYVEFIKNAYEKSV